MCIRDSQKAGSKCVYELHGSVYRNRCQRCGKQYPPEFIRDYKGVPHCDCGGLIKPEVVLYEEGLDEACIDGAVRAISRADILIVGGTSLTVYPSRRPHPLLRRQQISFNQPRRDAV